MTKRRITCLCLAVLLLMPMLFTGCGKETEKVLASYTQNSMARIGGDALIAQNSNYRLVWAESAQRFILQDLASGTSYLSAPLKSASDEISAPVSVEYYEEDTAVLTTVGVSGASGCLDADTYSVERIENGLRAVYSFDKEKIAITVEYLLRDDGLEIRVPIDGLQEEKCRIFEIKVAPFFAAVENDTGSYLMVPSGSGALIKAETGINNALYYESVYGEDMSEPVTFRKRVQNQVYLPVFGAMNVPKSESASATGMLGVIEQGAECAMIYAQTGGMESEYSTVYPSFRIRSKEKVVYNDQGHTKKSGLRYSDAVVDLEYLSVRYIPMDSKKGEDVTYNGMAARYRKYLQERGFLKEAVTNAPSLSVNMLGATQITESLFGIPYQSDVAVTTLSKTQEIVTELKELLGDKQMLVTLEGYGQGGLAKTTVGGGFKLSSTVGKKKDLAALVSYAAENGIILSMDYELAQFQNAGKGIRLGRDTAQCISTLKAQIGTFNMNTGLLDEKGLAWYLVARGKLVSLMDKTMASVAKNNMSAISIGSLNYMVYSDFRTEGYAASSSMANDVAVMLQQATAGGVTVVADEANEYVAINADYITEVPMHSTQFNMFAEEIPFYSMVFQGYVPLTASSINLAVDPTDAYLRAVATGTGLQFTLCDTLHESTLWDEDTAFVSSRYVDWKDTIAEMVNESADYYAKVGTQSIVRYENHGDVSVTEFADGTVVYVNYADEAVTYDGVTLEANSFSYR